MARTEHTYVRIRAKTHRCPSTYDDRRRTERLVPCSYVSSTEHPSTTMHVARTYVPESFHRSLGCAPLLTLSRAPAARWSAAPCSGGRYAPAPPSMACTMHEHDPTRATLPNGAEQYMDFLLTMPKQYNDSPPLNVFFFYRSTYVCAVASSGIELELSTRMHGACGTHRIDC